MKLKCTLSGLECEISNFRLIRSRFDYVHPIFTLSKDELLHIYYGNRFYDKSDNIRLLTTALLYSTELVRFDCAVNMGMSIKPLLIALPRLVDLIDTLRFAPVKVFAHVAVNQENNTLYNINSWLDIWEANYKDLCRENREYLKLQSELRQANQELLDSIARKAYKKPDRYHRMLARYIIACISDKSLNSIIDVKNANKQGTTKMLLKDYYIYIIEYCGILEPEDYKYIIDLPSEDYGNDNRQAHINRLMDIIRITFFEKENQHYYRVMELLNNMISDTKILSNIGRAKYQNYQYISIGDYYKDTKPRIDRLKQIYEERFPLTGKETKLDLLLRPAKIQAFIADNGDNLETIINDTNDTDIDIEASDYE